MPRNRTQTLSDGAQAAWEQLESYRLQHDLTTRQMGQLLGTSAGAYRGWRSRGEMPTAFWQRFQAHRARTQPSGASTPRGISLPDPYWQLLHALGDGNYSAGVRALIQQYLTPP